MNPIFVLLVILAAVLLWFLLSFAFPWIGKLTWKLWKDAEYNMRKEEKEEKEEKDYYEG